MNSSDNLPKNILVNSSPNCNLTSSDCSTDTTKYAKKTWDWADHIDKLIPSPKGRKNHYICPVCDGNHLEVDYPGTNAYTCWTSLCEQADIREALAPIGDAEFNARRKREAEAPIACLPLPKKFELALASKYAPAKSEPKEHNPPRKNPLKRCGDPNELCSKEVLTWFRYDMLHTVLRTDAYRPDGSRIDKETIPMNWESGEPHAEWNKGQQTWGAYRIQLVEEFAAGKVVLVVEGEKTVEALLAIGLIAVTFQGSAWNEAGMTPGIESMKAAGITGCVYIEDNDTAGIAKGKKFAKFATQLGVPCLVTSTKHFYPSAQDADDMDDYINDAKEKGMTIEQIKTEIEEKVQAIAAEAEREQAEATQPVIPSGTGYSIKEQIIKLLLSGESLEDEPFCRLRKQSWHDMSPADFNTLANKLKRELERKDNRSNVNSSLQDLLKLQNKRVRARRVFPKSIAEIIELLSARIGFQEESYIGALITGIGSMHKPGTCLEIWGTTEWYVTPNPYFFLHGGSGSGKSQITKAMITSPINAYHAELAPTLAAEREQWEEACKIAKQKGQTPPPEPQPRLFYTTDYTTQAIAPYLEKNPNKGLLILADELETLIENFNRFDKKGGGGGGDRSFLQSLLDGKTPLSVLRANDKRYVVKEHNVALIGNLPTEILKAYLREKKDSGGFWARFLCCEQQGVYKPINRKDKTKIDVTPRLKALYKAVDNLPVTVYKLHPQSEPIIDAWIDLCGFQAENPSTPEELRKIWAKHKELVAKILVNLHVIWYAGQGMTVPELIPPEITLAAVEYAQFCFAQTCLMYSELIAAKDDVAPELRKVLNKAEYIAAKEKTEWVKIDTIRSTFSKKQRDEYTSDDVFAWAKELEAMGYAECREVRGQGRPSAQMRVLKPSAEEKDVCSEILERFSVYSDINKTERTEEASPYPIATPSTLLPGLPKLTDAEEKDEEFDFESSRFNPENFTTADLEPATAKGSDVEPKQAVAGESEAIEVEPVKVAQTAEEAAEFEAFFNSLMGISTPAIVGVQTEPEVKPETVTVDDKTFSIGEIVNRTENDLTVKVRVLGKGLIGSSDTEGFIVKHLEGKIDPDARVEGYESARGTEIPEYDEAAIAEIGLDEVGGDDIGTGEWIVNIGEIRTTSANFLSKLADEPLIKIQGVDCPVEEMVGYKYLTEEHAYVELMGESDDKIVVQCVAKLEGSKCPFQVGDVVWVERNTLSILPV